MPHPGPSLARSRRPCGRHRCCRTRTGFLLHGPAAPRSQGQPAEKARAGARPAFLQNPRESRQPSADELRNSRTSWTPSSANLPPICVTAWRRSFPRVCGRVRVGSCRRWRASSSPSPSWLPCRGSGVRIPSLRPRPSVAPPIFPVIVQADPAAKQPSPLMGRCVEQSTCRLELEKGRYRADAELLGYHAATLFFDVDEQTSGRGEPIVAEPGSASAYPAALL